MLLRIGQITRVYCVLLCFRLACQAFSPSEIEKAFKSKILAAIKKNRIQARTASSGSENVNSLVPPVIKKSTPPISKAETSVPATSSGGKGTHPVITPTVETPNGANNPETVVSDSTSTSRGKPVKPKNLDSQSVDVNININNNINNQDPVTTETVPQKKTTTKSSQINCEYACKFITLPTCGCTQGAWA
ncbi:uncharacterized protein LOC117322483 [Pecten maximus]|uniref:uncharacterized protein LOC117322483 n=1 Tax=Pecten maximus TaxID=6579 RepID=UPI001458FAE7|nr:uncharacterized protein LOC117322483 [Pecten maximus]